MRANVGEHRNEGLLERALAENPPQQVGQPERDVEGVGFRARAEDAGDQHVPARPVTRDNSVKLLTVARERKRFTAGDCAARRDRPGRLAPPCALRMRRIVCKQLI